VRRIDKKSGRQQERQWSKSKDGLEDKQTNKQTKTKKIQHQMEEL